MAGTHAGVALQLRQQLLGRQQEVEEAAEGVATVTALCHAEDLAAERGGGALAGWVESGQRGVDAALQTFRVLQVEQKGGGWGHRSELPGAGSQAADDGYACPSGRALSSPVRSRFWSAKRPESRRMGFQDSQTVCP